MPSLDVVSFHKDLVRFPSLSHEEGPIADFIEDYVRETGVIFGRHGNNVYFWLGEGPDGLLLNSHLDVVPPSAGAPYDPFEPVEVDGKVYGRGTVDAKASVASITVAMLELAREGWRPKNGRAVVAFTTCEETGGDYNGLEDVRPHLPNFQSAIVGEPTALQPCVAQKGLLILKGQARGRSAHAARAHLGDNAIVTAARDVLKLDQYVFDREDTFLGKPTITVTIIEGGTARNVVPDLCTFFLDIRSTPAYTHDELITRLSNYLESDLEVHSKRIIPVATDLSERIVKACLAAVPGAKPFGSPTASDWIFLSDLPAIKLGPGRSQLSHTAQEHIETSELLRAVSVYKAIIRSYFNGTRS